MTHIGPEPPPEMYAAGVEIGCHCARCGSSCDWSECTADGCCDGVVEDLDDDGFDSLDRRLTCPDCRGFGGVNVCLSSAEWCEANPLPGRESVRRGKIEWFTFIETGGATDG